MTPAGRESCALSDSDASSDCDGVNDDRDALAQCRQALGLSINYVRTWRPHDAFREFFQNWKDAITETCGLGSRAFRLDITDDGGVYIAEARHPDTGDLLGFIRYKENEGILELTNFKASLSRATLDLGSKREKGHLAGTHGEGFKIAALVMAREGYQARIESSNYYWRFAFGGRSKSHLYCNLTPVSEAKLQKQMRAYALKAEQPRELQNNVWEDVSIKLGRVHGPRWGGKIRRQDFDQWVKVAIDLDCTTEIIRTSHGSLILDERFSNKVFLKGLLLEGQAEGRRFKYGYDFHHGTVGRDRKSLENSSEESETLANIWGEAVTRQEGDCLSRYVSMLWEQPKWADVGQAEGRMSGTTAKAIWDYLQAQASGLNTFYHDDRHGDRDIELIRRSLKKEPAQLPACIWEPLRRFHHVRTPQEERYHMLHNAPAAAEKSTPYASMVKTALRASLCLDTRTKDLELVFKDGTAAELDLLLDGTQLMVNEKWLDFHASHENVPCWLSRLSTAAGFSGDIFSCDHVITELYDMILMEVDKHRGEQGHGATEADGLLRLRLVENLRQMPRVIETAPGCDPGEIDVTWMDSEGGLAAKLHGLDVKYRVTLHRERTCALKRFDLVTSDDDPNDEPADSEDASYTAGCGCPQQLVSQKESNTTFRSLEYEEAYFPMISRTYPQAFYGIRVSPVGIRPRAPGMSGEASRRISVSSKQDLLQQEHEGAGDDLYDSPDEFGDDLGWQSLPSSTIETVPVQSGRSCSPPLRLKSGEAAERWLNRIRDLKRELERAGENLDEKDRQLQDAQANAAILQNKLEAGAAMQAKADEGIANLTSEKRVLEGKLHNIARLEKDKADLHAQLLIKIREIREVQAVPDSAQQALDQLGKGFVAFETVLRQADPINYRILSGGLQQKLDLVCKSLELQRSESQGLKVENEAKRKLLEEHERLLRTQATALDAQCTALEAADLELYDARASNKALEDNLEYIQDELSRSLWMASKLAARLNGRGSAAKRRRIEELEGAPSGQGQKRVRDESCDSPNRNVAESPILLD